MLARISVSLTIPLREKIHINLLIRGKELLSYVHFNIAVEPGRNVMRVPLGGGVIFAKPKRNHGNVSACFASSNITVYIGCPKRMSIIKNFMKFSLDLANLKRNAKQSRIPRLTLSHWTISTLTLASCDRLTLMLKVQQYFRISILVFQINFEAVFHCWMLKITTKEMLRLCILYSWRRIYT